MKRGIFWYKPSLEEAATGQQIVEDELTFYAKLNDKTLLDKAASKEEQEQWEIKLPKTPDTASAGRLRVRKTTVLPQSYSRTDGITSEYVLTAKTRLEGGTELEVANPSSSDAFEQFKRLAPNGMIKTRYIFPIEGTDAKWEIDVFKNKDGTPCEWVKIDFEKTPTCQEPPVLPEGLIEVINFKQANFEEKVFVSNLYSNSFLTKNIYL
jgi:hypothetical protein